MIRQRRAALSVGLVGADYLAAVAAFRLAAALRFGAGWAEQSGTALPPWPGLVATLFGLYVVAMFWSAGLYSLRARWSFRSELHDILRAAGVTFAVTIGALYLLKLGGISRGFVAAYFVLLTVGAVAGRAAVRQGLRWLRLRGRGLRHLLVVGGGPPAQRFLARATRHPEFGVRVVGVVDDALPGIDGQRWLGPLAALPRILTDEVVDEVAICLSWEQWPAVDALARLCQEQGKVVRIPVNLTPHAVARGLLEDLEGLPVLSLVSGPDHGAALAVKRLVDVVGAAVLLVVTCPVLLAAAVAVRVCDGAPVLFRQARGGLHGRPFLALKFRTMVRDAEARKQELADRNERVGPAFKVTDDPRVTKVGRVLRTTSIDELPQLWNVLKGDMSLVGPRPQPVDEVRAYDLWHRRRLSVRPGLTGLWQVTARGEPDFDRWVELDLYYIDHWSIWMDLRLLAKTPLAVARATGR